MYGLRDQILLEISDRTGRHFQGLQQAARVCQATGQLSGPIVKKLLSLDEAYNLIRHITTVSSAEFLEKVKEDLNQQTEPDPGRQRQKVE